VPIHDWSQVPAGLFHHFHQSWSIRIADALNAGRLPSGVEALIEQRVGLREAGILSIERRQRDGRYPERNGGVVTLERPVARIVQRSDRHMYAARANRIVVRHHLGRMIAVIEIVSPGAEAHERDFRTKRDEYLAAGVLEYVIVDPQTRAVLDLTRHGDRWREQWIREHGEWRPALLPGFSLKLDELFAVLDRPS